MNALAAQILAPAILLAISPPEPSPAQPLQIEAPKPQKSRRLFIASGIVLGIAGIGEMAGAIVASQCTVGSSCAVGFAYAWGSPEADTRYTFVSAGIGSAYTLARVGSVPLIWTGAGLLLAGTHARALTDAANGTALAPAKPLAWGLLGSGVGLYVLSRIARIGFAVGGVCQDPRCVYAFDQTTLGLSRGMSFSGSALVLRRRTLQRVRLGVAPMASYGLMVTGQF
jgi:hypothetical protein